jgi:hypothetical protein
MTKYNRFIHGQAPSTFWTEQRLVALDTQDGELDAQPDLNRAARKLARNEGHSPVSPLARQSWWRRYRAAAVIAGTLCAGSFLAGSVVEAYAELGTSYPAQFSRTTDHELRVGLRNPELLARLGLCEKVLGLQRDLEILYAQDVPDLPEPYRDRADAFEAARSLAVQHNVPCETDATVYKMTVDGYRVQVEPRDFTVFPMASDDRWCQARESVVAHRDGAPDKEVRQYYNLAEILGQEVSRQHSLDC